MNKTYKAQGWTLVELMIVVGIIGVLAAIAVPAYNGYIETSESSTTAYNLRQLATFEENYFYDEGDGDYFYATYTPPGVNLFEAAIGWTPDGDNDAFIYEVAPNATCVLPDTVCATITVKYVSNPTAIVQTLDLNR